MKAGVVRGGAGKWEKGGQREGGRGGWAGRRGWSEKERQRQE